MTAVLIHSQARSTVKRVVKRDNARRLGGGISKTCARNADLYALTEGEEITIAPGETKLIHTGIATEIPEGYGGFIYARSGLASKKGLAPANKVGVVDADYRGEIMVALHNHGTVSQTIGDKERIAQFVIAPFIRAEYEEADELSDTVRGEGGFGSTGRK